MTTKKVHIFKKGDWWRIGNIPKSITNLDIDAFVGATNFAARLNNRIADKKCDESRSEIKQLNFGKLDLTTLEQQPYKRGGLCP